MKLLRYLTLFPTLFVSLVSFAQSPPSDSLDQRDAEGKKHGLWTEYLAEDLRMVTKKKNAVFYRYTYYHHGRATSPMAYQTESKKSIKTDGARPGKKGEPVLLDGTYNWFYPSGSVQMILTFDRGMRKGKALYYYRSGSLMVMEDYDRLFEDQPYSHYFEEYYNNKGEQGEVHNSGYSRVGPEGWMEYPIFR